MGRSGLSLEGSFLAVLVLTSPLQPSLNAGLRFIGFTKVPRPAQVVIERIAFRPILPLDNGGHDPPTGKVLVDVFRVVHAGDSGNVLRVQALRGRFCCHVRGRLGGSPF